LRPRSLLSCLVAVALLSGAPAYSAKVFLLDEKTLEGEVLGLTEKAVVLKTGGQEQSVELEQILRIVFEPSVSAPAPESFACVAFLTDGSEIRAQSVTIQGGYVALDASGGSTVKAPAGALGALFLGSSPEADATFQKELKSSQRTSDVLFLRKGDRVLRLEGAAQSFDGNVFRFLWEEEELEVPKEKVAAIVFYRPQERAAPRPLCRLSEVFGGAFEASSLDLNNGVFAVQTPSGVAVSIPYGRVTTLDYSLARVTFLSSIDPVSAREEPYFDVVWHYRRDQNLRGGDIALGGKTFARGLSLHSRCRLTYALGGQYKRFRALVGIDDSAGNWGHVVCQVRGDDKILFESELRGGDAPRELDLDLAGVKLLTLFVDFVEKLDIGDRVSFADARLIK